MTETTNAYKVIGTRPLRPDGADKVTGKAIYHTPALNRLIRVRPGHCRVCGQS
jgi:hypothetical protein